MQQKKGNPTPANPAYKSGPRKDKPANPIWEKAASLQNEKQKIREEKVEAAFETQTAIPENPTSTMLAQDTPPAISSTPINIPANTSNSGTILQPGETHTL